MTVLVVAAVAVIVAGRLLVVLVAFQGHRVTDQPRQHQADLCVL